MNRSPWLRNVFLVCFSFFVLACSPSKPDEKSGVKNRRPVPEFTIPERAEGRNYVHFIGLGDQGTGSSAQRQVALLMNNKSKQDSLDFVITLGDNFYRRGVTSVTDQQWVDKFESMYNLSHLNVPFYATLGNHDHRLGRAKYQVEYSKTSSKWQMPHHYYTFEKQIDSGSSIQFFALDTEAIAQDLEYSGEQIQWLDRELRASTAMWKVVYGHHPVHSYGKHGDEKRMIELVRPLLEEYGVDFYVSGHDHDRQLLGPVNGVTYIVSGTGSKSRNTRYGEKTIFAETNLGFTWFRVSSQEFHVQFINGDGQIEYAHTVTKQAI